MTVRWLEADWPAEASIKAGTTLRDGGMSKGAYRSLNLGANVADDPAAVIENRRRLVQACELPSAPNWLRQTHSTNVAHEEPANPDSGTDAIITRRAQSVCAVLTADCLPLLFAAVDGSEVAAAHAGWRGLCEGIIEATLNGMQTRPSMLLVWLGPAISQPAFEVGAEVREQFLASNSAAAEHFVENANGRYQADLYGLARQRLEAAGVSRIYGGGRCTFGEPDNFFSYRRGGQCGRMASFIYRAK